MILYKKARNLAKGILSRIPSSILFKTCRFYVNTYNNDADCYFYTNGEYRLIKRLLPKCKTVFDVGASIGDWAEMALAINPDLNIHAFEPGSKPYQKILEKKLPITANKFGLSHTVETGTLYYGTVGGSNSLYPSIDHAADQSTETIDMTTIDDYCQQNNIQQIDFMKIDVEGNELAVLKGANKMLASGKISHIQFEYGPNYIDAGCLLKHVFEFIQDTQPQMGFYKIMQRGLKKVPAYAYPYENFLNSVWLIAK